MDRFRHAYPGHELQVDSDRHKIRVVPPGSPEAADHASGKASRFLGPADGKMILDSGFQGWPSQLKQGIAKGKGRPTGAGPSIETPRINRTSEAWLDKTRNSP